MWPGGFLRGFLSSPLRSLFFILALLCSPALASFGQSFDPGKIYPVSGADLNRLELDLKTAKIELETLRIRNEQQEKDSESKENALIELETRLTTASQSWRESQNEAVFNLVATGVASFFAGMIVDRCITLYSTR